MEAHALQIEHADDPDASTLWSLIVIFAGEYVSGDPRGKAGEIAQVAWFDSTPELVLYPEVATRPIPFHPTSDS